MYSIVKAMDFGFRLIHLSEKRLLKRNRFGESWMQKSIISVFMLSHGEERATMGNREMFSNQQLKAINFSLSKQ
jgi:hypothetical protein